MLDHPNIGMCILFLALVVYSKPSIVFSVDSMLVSMARSKSEKFLDESC